MKSLAELIKETEPAKIPSLFVLSAERLSGQPGMFHCERCGLDNTPDRMQLVLGRVNCLDMASCMRRRVPNMPAWKHYNGTYYGMGGFERSVDSCDAISATLW